MMMIQNNRINDEEAAIRTCILLDVIILENWRDFPLFTMSNRVAVGMRGNN